MTYSRAKLLLFAWIGGDFPHGDVDGTSGISFVCVFGACVVVVCYRLAWCSPYLVAYGFAGCCLLKCEIALQVRLLLRSFALWKLLRSGN